MFVYIYDLYSSLEGKSHYPALQRKNQDSNPFAAKICTLTVLPLFLFKGFFPEHVTSLPEFEDSEPDIMMTWS